MSRPVNFQGQNKRKNEKGTKKHKKGLKSKITKRPMDAHLARGDKVRRVERKLLNI